MKPSKALPNILQHMPKRSFLNAIRQTVGLIYHRDVVNDFQVGQQLNSLPHCDLYALPHNVDVAAGDITVTKAPDSKACTVIW